MERSYLRFLLYNPFAIMLCALTVGLGSLFGPFQNAALAGTLLAMMLAASSRLSLVRRRIERAWEMAERAALCARLDADQLSEYNRLERQANEVRLIAPAWAKTIDRVIHDGFLRSAVLSNQLTQLLRNGCEPDVPPPPLPDDTSPGASIRMQRIAVARRAAEDRVQAERSLAVLRQRLVQMSELVDAVRQRALLMSLFDTAESLGELADDDIDRAHLLVEDRDRATSAEAT
jgi:hypothetical protein